jgi:hypothetical protein
MHLNRIEIKVKSETLTCYVGGEGPPMLFLHSSGGARLTPALERLAEKYRIYMPIIPGFDGTRSSERLRTMLDVADLAAEFVDTAIKSPCDVIGQSFGGRSAAWRRQSDQMAKSDLAGVLKTHACGFLPILKTYHRRRDLPNGSRRTELCPCVSVAAPPKMRNCWVG